MKRIVSLLLLLLTAVPLLAACHGAKALPAFEIPAEFDENAHYEITFWAKNDTNKTQTNIYHKAIEDFQAIYPNITVNLRLYTDYGKIYNDVITNISTQTTPNVCITYPDHIATYLTGNNVVVPLDSLLTDEKYGLGGEKVKFDAPEKDELIPKFLEECMINGHYYALPYMRSTEALFINKTYVEALGYTLPEKITWDFVWEVSDAATAKNEDGTYKVNGQKVMIPFIYKSTDNMMIQMLRQKGADYSTENGDILLFGDETKELLKTVADHAALGSFSTFKISSYPANFLNAGQCLFAIDSTAGSTWMGPKAPLLDISEDALVDFECVVTEIPQFDPDHPQMISQGPSVCVFNKKDSGEVLASWLFAQFLLTNDVQIPYSETEGYVPVTTKAQNDPSYTEYLSHVGEESEQYYSLKLDAVRLFLDHVNDTFVTPVFNGSASLRDAAGSLIENTTKSVRRKETIDDSYFDTMFSNTRSQYHLDQIRLSSGVREELGALPATAAALLIALAAAWVLIVLWFVLKKVRANGKAK